MNPRKGDIMTTDDIKYISKDIEEVKTTINKLQEILLGQNGLREGQIRMEENLKVISDNLQELVNDSKTTKMKIAEVEKKLDAHLNDKDLHTWRIVLQPKTFGGLVLLIVFIVVLIPPGFTIGSLWDLILKIAGL